MWIAGTILAYTTIEDDSNWYGRDSVEMQDTGMRKVGIT